MCSCFIHVWVVYACVCGLCVFGYDMYVCVCVCMAGYDIYVCMCVWFMCVYVCMCGLCMCMCDIYVHVWV